MSEHFSMKIPMQAPTSKIYTAIADADGPSHWWTKFARGIVGNEENDRELSADSAQQDE